MTHHIFTKSGELFLIIGQVPEKPVHITDPTDVVAAMAELEQHKKYFATISRLKDSAIRIPDYYNTLGMLFHQQVKNDYKESPHAFRAWKEKYIKDGELYQIECEVDIEENCKLACNCEHHCLRIQTPEQVAILKRVAKQEP